MIRNKSPFVGKNALKLSWLKFTGLNLILLKKTIDAFFLIGCRKKVKEY